MLTALLIVIVAAMTVEFFYQLFKLIFSDDESARIKAFLTMLFGVLFCSTLIWSIVRINQ